MLLSLAAPVAFLVVIGATLGLVSCDDVPDATICSIEGVLQPQSCAFNCRSGSLL